MLIEDDCQDSGPSLTRQEGVFGQLRCEVTQERADSGKGEVSRRVEDIAMTERLRELLTHLRAAANLPEVAPPDKIGEALNTLTIHLLIAGMPLQGNEIDMRVSKAIREALAIGEPRE